MSWFACYMRDPRPRWAMTAEQRFRSNLYSRRRMFRRARIERGKGIVQLMRLEGGR